MGIWRTSTAIIVGIIAGIVGFMLYHQQTNLPMADLLNASTQQQGGSIEYQINNGLLTISNNSKNMSGSLTILISFNPMSIALITGETNSNYDYVYNMSRDGNIALTVEGDIQVGQIISIPVQGESSDISISSPTLFEGNISTAFSITRIE